MVMQVRPSAARPPSPQGAVARHEVDRRICTALSELAPAQAMEAVDRFARTDLSTVRSKTGFMLSIISRVAREVRGAERWRDEWGCWAGPLHEGLGM